MFQGNRTEVPSRQPFNAPSGLVTQKNEGFEHFLKTHSSPNHQRVTAGGRIIPMEMRPVPPRFSLSALKETPDTGSDQKMDQVPQILNTSKNHFADRNSGMNSPSKVGASRYDNASSNALISLTVSPDLPSHESIPLNLQQAALESNILMQNQLLAYGQGLSSGSLYPTVPGISGQVTHLGQQYPMNLPYLPYAASSMSNDLSNSDLPLAWNADPYVLSTLRAMLTQANQSFEIYDQQLKDLDKYRATHNRQDELVRQRVTIVARRAEIKDEIRRLQATISVRENEHTMVRSVPPPWSSADTQSPLLKQHRASGRPLTIQVPHQVSDATSKAKPTATSKLNVSAAAYVPVKKANTIASSTSASKIGSSAELRMLELPTSRYLRIGSGSPELKATDSWGERVGAPPVHLLREQKSLAEAILSLSNSPKVSDDDTSNSTSAQSCTFTSEPTNKTASPNPGAGFHRTRRAPAPIEADYERQIDAMRKPEGTVSHIFLSDGRSQVVHGVNLKQPRPDNMTDFEHAYWARKPPYHDYSSFGKENSRAPSFTAKTSTLSFENSVHSQDQAKPYSGSLRKYAISPLYLICLLTIC